MSVMCSSDCQTDAEPDPLQRATAAISSRHKMFFLKHGEPVMTL
jgi:hypothetical protein